MESALRVLLLFNSPSTVRLLETHLDQDRFHLILCNRGDCVTKLKEFNHCCSHNRPDVILLEPEQDGMAGLRLLESLGPEFNIPIVCLSSYVGTTKDLTPRLLELGVKVVIPKLGVGSSRKVENLVSSVEYWLTEAGTIGQNDTLPIPRPLVSAPMNTDLVVGIGASTGGCEALTRVLKESQLGSPPIVFVIHMPGNFTTAFANRLNKACPGLTVREARNGDHLSPGLALLAPGGLHMEIAKSYGKPVVKLISGEKVHHQIPAVDVTLATLAKICGKKSMGVVLTGMGKDGAQGLLQIRQAGGHTIAQSEKTCVVFGMPRESIAIGAAEFVEDLDLISSRLVSLVEER